MPKLIVILGMNNNVYITKSVYPIIKDFNLLVALYKRVTLSKSNFNINSKPTKKIILEFAVYLLPAITFIIKSPKRQVINIIKEKTHKVKRDVELIIFLHHLKSFFEYETESSFHIGLKED